MKNFIVFYCITIGGCKEDDQMEMQARDAGHAEQLVENHMTNSYGRMMTGFYVVRSEEV